MMRLVLVRSFFFFFNDTATTEIYTLSLHDALPIYVLAQPDLLLGHRPLLRDDLFLGHRDRNLVVAYLGVGRLRSEEHTSELQSRQYLVCRLLLEKKKYNHHSNQ